MKGYKGMSKDMTCRGMQYEVGKTYHVDGKIELCSNGLHFCERLKDVFAFYDSGCGNRYFEVYAGGQIMCGWGKIAASELTILRELTDIEVNRYIYGDGHGNGSCSGYRDGYGYGCGNGSGEGNGYGDGYGYGNGNGQGYGYESGSGWGYGSTWYGDGEGHGILPISEILIYKGE